MLRKETEARELLRIRILLKKSYNRQEGNNGMELRVPGITIPIIKET